MSCRWISKNPIEFLVVIGNILDFWFLSGCSYSVPQCRAFPLVGWSSVLFPRRHSVLWRKKLEAAQELIPNYDFGSPLPGTLVSLLSMTVIYLGSSFTLNTFFLSFSLSFLLPPILSVYASPKALTLNPFFFWICSYNNPIHLMVSIMISRWLLNLQFKAQSLFWVADVFLGTSCFAQLCCFL